MSTNRKRSPTPCKPLEQITKNQQPHTTHLKIQQINSSNKLKTQQFTSTSLQQIRNNQKKSQASTGNHESIPQNLTSHNQSQNN